MPRAEAATLVLRTRIELESLRQGEITRALVNQLSQVVLVVNFITAAGHGLLGMDFLEHTEHELARVPLEADQTDPWQISSVMMLIWPPS